MNRYFADLSNNNAHFDAQAYRKAGHLLVALKASEGVGFMDPLYRKRRHEAHAARLAVVHYHFARPDRHPGRAGGKDEAHAFLAAIKGGVGKRDALCIDVERGSNAQASQGYLDEFANQLKRIYPHKPLILYRSRANHTNLKDSRNWVAAYDGHRMALLAGVGTWAHQFTDGTIGAEPHSCAGVGRCDISRLNMRSYLRLRASR